MDRPPGETAGVPQLEERRSIQDASNIDVVRARSTETSLALEDSKEKPIDAEALSGDKQPVLDYPNGGLRGERPAPSIPLNL